MAGMCTQRRMRSAATLASLAAAALLAAGCGSSSGGSSGPAGQAIKRAAYVSSSAAGYRVTIQLKEGAASINGQVTGTGSGSFNIPKHAGRLTLNLNLPGSLSKAGTLTVQEVLTGEKMFIKLPASISSKLPGGKPWLEINLAQIGRAAGIQNLTSLFGGSGSTNPGQFLQYLRATSANGVKTIGHASVDGVQTTHYSAIVDLLKAPAAAPASERASLSQAVSSLERLTGLRNIPVDVWVDSQHLVRRIAMSYSINAAGQNAQTQMQMDFLSYGPQPVPAPPPAGQVTDATTLLSKGAGSAGLG